VCRGHRVPHCIVVRHLSLSQDDIQHGTGDAYQHIGKRPSKRLEVRRLTDVILITDRYLNMMHRNAVCSYKLYLSNEML